MTTNQAKVAIGNLLKDEGRAEASALLRAKWTGHFDKAIRSGGGLASVPVPPREPIIGKWFRQGDLGFIYGPRGLGKTWLAMFLARKCAEGSSLGGLTEWNVQGVRRVLYVDGEMSIDGIRERDAALSVGPAPGMYYLQHEALFHLTGEVLNLAEPEAQASLLDRCRRDRIEILF
ncbi:MAG TPA: AAA family ATPase, partial [Candidatus Acidoferrales bacterium]|nr:AAA family ATPase [Candidatus Acidoferrales bacterium]